VGNVLGNTFRGLLAAAVISNAAILVGAINGTVDWSSFYTGLITSGAVLLGALIDPGSQPPKPAPVVEGNK